MGNSKWYLSTWFISIWFALSFLYLPFFVGLVLLFLQIKENKKIKQEWENSGFGDVVQAREQKDKIQKEGDKLQAKLVKLKSEVNNLAQDISSKKDELVILDDELLYQSFGFYDPKYDFEKVEEYKAQLDKNRESQKLMVKDNKATTAKEWTVDGSKKKGAVMTNNISKVTIRAFNNECDTSISKVKFNNIEATEKRIRTAREQLNKTNKHYGIEIKEEYLQLKLKELYMAYEYEVKKEEEKEEQRQIKEQMREEKKIQQEIEHERKKLEKDEQHFNNAIESYKKQLETASDEMKIEIENKMTEINEKLAEIQKEKEAVDFREQNAKAGYVYIISNIGSFGEEVFKIGMTRRLEPLERVNELGNASVPFVFDVHAMVFSDDAPKLENALHKAFEMYQVNKVNPRKEFFNVKLDEIARVIKENHNKTVEFTKLAAAEDYRKSLLISKNEPIGVGA